MPAHPALTRSIIRLLLRLLIIPSRSLRPILLIRPILAPVRIRKRFAAPAAASASAAEANPRPTAPATAAAPVETSAVAAASLVIMWASRQVGVRRSRGLGDVVVLLISIIVVDRRPALLIKAGRTGRRLLVAAPRIVARLLHITIVVKNDKKKTKPKAKQIRASIGAESHLRIHAECFKKNSGWENNQQSLLYFSYQVLQFGKVK